MKLRKIIANLLSLGLVLSPMCVYADDSVVAQSEDGTSTYTDYDSAWNAALDGIKIVMTSDWNLNSRLIVSEGKTVTIEMNGHKMDRALGFSDKFNGEVIYLDDHSTLTLTGNNFSDTQFNFQGFNLAYELSDLTIISGGLVTGGCSTDGAGGIHMKKGTTLNLENVAVAGNLASNASGQSQGGGIKMDNDDCTVNMTNSYVSYNYSSYNGGGIYVDGENSYINMVSSEISHNCSSHNGGGIFSNDDATYVTMNQNSKITENKAGRNGGGIHFDNPYCQVVSGDSAAEISDNVANYNGGGIYFESSYRGKNIFVEGITFQSNVSETNEGGAIYITQKNVMIKNCQFYENKAELGGAIYIDSSNTTISNCTIQKNSALKEGGGVEVICDYDVNLVGKVIVENNSREDGSKDDIFLNKGLFSKAYVSGTPELESRVGIRCSSERQVGINQTEDNGSFFSDEDSYKISYKDGELYKESGSVLGSIFGNANLGAAIVIIVGIAGVGVVCLIVSKKKKNLK